MNQIAGGAWIVGAMFAGFMSGMIPLGIALRNRRFVAGAFAFFFCFMAGIFGGMCLALPMAAVASGLLHILGEAPGAARIEADPWARNAIKKLQREEESPKARAPYTIIGPVVVCADCQWSHRKGDNGAIPQECEKCGLAFVRGKNVPVAKPLDGEETPPPLPVASRVEDDVPAEPYESIVDLQVVTASGDRSASTRRPRRWE